MKEIYEKVAYVGLRDEKGKYIANIPLYVKTTDIGKYGVSYSTEELIHKVSQIMLKHYEKRLTEYMSQKKEPSQDDSAETN